MLHKGWGSFNFSLALVMVCLGIVYYLIRRSCEIRSAGGGEPGDGERRARASALSPHSLTYGHQGSAYPLYLRSPSSPAVSMPTATMTTTAPPAISLKGSRAIPSSSSAATTLRSLYPRAARAFLQRDVALTFSLLSSAFSLIAPPDSVATTNDALASHRRKWEILRLTFETTLYASPPSTQDPDSLPSALRANLMLSPEPLIATLHTR